MRGRSGRRDHPARRRNRGGPGAMYPTNSRTAACHGCDRAATRDLAMPGAGCARDEQSGTASVGSDPSSSKKFDRPRTYREGSRQIAAAARVPCPEPINAPLGQIPNRHSSNFNLGQIPNLHSLIPYSLEARNQYFSAQAPMEHSSNAPAIIKNSSRPWRTPLIAPSPELPHSGICCASPSSPV